MNKKVRGCGECAWCKWRGIFFCFNPKICGTKFDQVSGETRVNPANIGYVRGGGECRGFKPKKIGWLRKRINKLFKWKVKE